MTEWVKKLLHTESYCFVRDAMTMVRWQYGTGARIASQPSLGCASNVGCVYTFNLLFPFRQQSTIKFLAMFTCVRAVHSFARNAHCCCENGECIWSAGARVNLIQDKRCNPCIIRCFSGCRSRITFMQISLTAAGKLFHMNLCVRHARDYYYSFIYQFCCCFCVL